MLGIPSHRRFKQAQVHRRKTTTSSAAKQETWQHKGGLANLVRLSYSAAAAPASKDNRILAFSDVSPEIARFPVLRFLGNCRGADSWLRPRSSPSYFASAPVIIAYS
jgi:hypothetical protein